MPARTIPDAESEVPAVIRQQLNEALSAYYHACDHKDGEAFEIALIRHHAGREDGVCAFVVIGPASVDVEDLLNDIAEAVDRYLQITVEWYARCADAEVARGRR